VGLTIFIFAKRPKRISRWVVVHKVPRWVNKEADKIKKRYGGTSSWALNKTFYVRGRSNIYKLYFSGQGGNTHAVEKRLRH
jgi:hypothetical protein